LKTPEYEGSDEYDTTDNVAQQRHNHERLGRTHEIWKQKTITQWNWISRTHFAILFWNYLIVKLERWSRPLLTSLNTEWVNGGTDPSWQIYNSRRRHTFKFLRIRIRRPL